MNKKKKLINFIMLLLALLLLPSRIYASDTGLVTFDGQKSTFVYDKNTTDFTNAFKNIAPGETRSMKITLQNKHEKSMTFYFNVKALQDLKELNGANYHILILQDKKTLFDQTLSDAQNGLLGLDTAKGQTSKDFNLATLKKGESRDIEFQLTLDGSSVGNEYQGCSGIIQFQFRAEENEGTSSPVTNILKSPSVKTGDETNWLLPMIGLLGSGVILITVYRFTKKKGDHSNTE